MAALFDNPLMLFIAQVELIVLNIGLDIGVISPLLFTTLVIMALVTAFAATPLLGWIYPYRQFEYDAALSRESAKSSQPISSLGLSLR